MTSFLASLQSALAAAWTRREAQGFFARLGGVGATECFRVFHGPGEPVVGLGGVGVFSFSIDKFGDAYWITEWEGKGAELSAADTDAVVAFLRGKGAKQVAILKRPKQGLPNESQIIFGEDLPAELTARELGLSYAIRMKGVRHPGVFLDHRPLREELLKISSGRRVLNTFCFTGSLSVAAKKGGATEVMSVDLSKPTIEWARENGRLNFGEDPSLDYVFGDVFDWLPRFKKKGREFDLVILDPPSFSRGTKGTFSTSKDLVRLHSTALEVCADGAWLITSINSAQIPEEDFRRACMAAAAEQGCSLDLKRRVELPADFPTIAAQPQSKYLKGFYFQVSR